jgi:hypothetical protein
MSGMIRSLRSGAQLARRFALCADDVAVSPPRGHAFHDAVVSALSALCSHDRSAGRGIGGGHEKEEANTAPVQICGAQEARSVQVTTVRARG